MQSAVDSRNGIVGVLGTVPHGELESVIDSDIRHVDGIGSLEELLDTCSVQCLVVVHDPSESDRLDDIATLSESYPSVPLIAFVLDENAAVGSAVVSAGADEYVPAPAFGAPMEVLGERIRDSLRAAEGRRIPVDLFGAIGDPMVVHRRDDDDILAANDAYCELLGYDREELVGKSVADITATERVDADPESKIREAVERGSSTFEWADRRSDGEVIPVEVTLSTAQTSDMEYVLGVVRDITDRKERERQLREEQAFNEAIFAALPDAFYMFDEAGNFLRWNDRFSEMTGYDDAEIETMQPTEFIAEEDRADVVEAITDVFQNDTTITVEARFLTKDGERIPHEFTGGKVTDERGETLGLVGIGRDISTEKRRQRRFEAVFNNTYQFTGLMSPDGTLLEANDAALAFGGLDREEAVGTKLWDVYWFQDEGARAAAREAVQFARNGEFYREQITVQGADGTEIIDFSVRPITDDEGNVTLLIPEGRTITELKRRERHLGVLHRFLRHNLRNKLTVIRGNADLLARNLAGTEHERYAAQINDAALELAELSETAHELSKTITSSDVDERPIDVPRLLARLTEEFESRYPQASITVDHDDDYYVAADWRLEAVFEQLIENAIEHAGHGDPTVEVSVDGTEEAVSVHIADDGPGIPDEELVGITSDEEPTPIAHGTGFGLWLVRSVLDEYGAELEHGKRADGGSVLTVTLPRGTDYTAGGETVSEGEEA